MKPPSTTLPRCPLGRWPTPLRELPTLGAALGLEALWLKDDGECAEVYGGNKVRKLERTLARALAKGHRRVWTLGGLGSNHCLATALHGRSLGLSIRVLHFPQPVNDHVRRLVRAVASTGAEMELLGSARELPGRIIREHLAQRLRRPDARDFLLPAGGSSPEGVLGYVDAAREVAAQLAASGEPLPERVYVPAGTCGTLVGLWIGFVSAGLNIEVVGARVIPGISCNMARIVSLARRTLVTMQRAGLETPRWRALWGARPRLVHDQFGGGYGESTSAGLAARERMAEHGGPALETTYTAKAFAALIAEARAGRVRRALFWNTHNQRPLEGLAEGAPLETLPPEYRALLEER